MCKATVYREIQRGRLSPTYIGGAPRFSPEEVERYEKSRVYRAPGKGR